MSQATQSAGLLMYRKNSRGVQVFLCRPFSMEPGRKMHWGIPKGRVDPGESPEDAAKREFFEETGLMPPNVPQYYLGKVMYPSGKKEVSVWTFEFDPPKDVVFKSNYTKATDSNGTTVIIPEIAEWQWFDLDDAKKKIMVSQREVLMRFLRFMGKNTNSYGKEGNDQGSGKGDGKNRLQSIPRFSQALKEAE